MSETQEFEKAFFRKMAGGTDYIKASVTCYKGDQAPSWMDINPGLFFCRVVQSRSHKVVIRVVF